MTSSRCCTFVCRDRNWKLFFQSDAKRNFENRFADFNPWFIRGKIKKWKPIYRGDGEKIPLVVEKNAIAVGLEGDDETLVEPRFNGLMRFGSVSRVNIHCQGIKLLDRCERFHQEDDHAAALYRLDRARQQIRRQSFEVLKNAHAVRFAQNLVCILVVRPTYIRTTDKELERIRLIVQVNSTIFYSPFQIILIL